MRDAQQIAHRSRWPMPAWGVGSLSLEVQVSRVGVSNAIKPGGAGVSISIHTTTVQFFSLYRAAPISAERNFDPKSSWRYGLRQDLQIQVEQSAYSQSIIP